MTLADVLTLVGLATLLGILAALASRGIDKVRGRLGKRRP